MLGNTGGWLTMLKIVVNSSDFMKDLVDIIIFKKRF